MQKRILLLGAAQAQMPAISYAKEAGHYCITADYCPDNPGHKISHEWHNVSTTDLSGVLALAKQCRIDAILAYASDPAAPTAAYVSEKLSLPGSPFQAVNTLAQKNLFREFLRHNDFPTPAFFSTGALAEAQEKLHSLSLPLVVKPVDSSGSKGVSVIQQQSELPDAFKLALNNSRSGQVIVEEFIGRSGEQILGEAFIWNKQLLFCALAEHFFNCKDSALVPIGGIFPHPQLSAPTVQRCNSLVEALIQKSGYLFGAMNLELRISQQGEVYIMEAGPRNGGNMIPQLIRQAYGFDMVKYSVEAALGQNCSQSDSHCPQGYYAYMVIHSRKSGLLQHIKIAPELEELLLEKHLWLKPGDQVRAFNGANCSLGVLIAKSNDPQKLKEILTNIEQYIELGLAV